MERLLKTMIKAIVSQLKATNLAYGTLKRHKACLNSVTNYCATHDYRPVYSKIMIEGFLEEIKNSYEQGTITYGLLKDRRKAAYLIVQYSETGNYTPKHYFYNSKYTLTTPYFLKFLKEECLYYKETYHLSDGSNEHNFYITKKLCFYFQNKGFKSFKKLTIQDIIKFIECTKEVSKNTSKDTIQNLKAVLIYLREKHIVDINYDLSVLRPQRYPCSEIITFSKEERSTVLSCIDRRTLVGKRDYAIILLGITTGMRACDVVSLRLKDINWKKDFIDLIQNKTGKEIIIPLLENTSNALADYILNARTENKSKIIFLTTRNPIKGMVPYSLNNILRKYCKKGKVIKDHKCTFHSLRRSFCTWLSQDKTSVSLIAQCAGHSNIHAAERYISISPIMVKCCLDFTGIEPNHHKGV